MRNYAVLLFLLLVHLGLPSSDAQRFKVLCFFRSRSFTGAPEYVHPAVQGGANSVSFKAIQWIGNNGGNFQADYSEDPNIFANPNVLNTYTVVVFLFTQGTILNPAQRAGFQTWYKNPSHGWLGIHSADDTEPKNSYIEALVGTAWKQDASEQTYTLRINNLAHPAGRTLGNGATAVTVWDQILNYAYVPVNVKVIASVDESTARIGSPGVGRGVEMGPNHPMIWCSRFDGGKAFFSGLGHMPHLWGVPGNPSACPNGPPSSPPYGTNAPSNFNWGENCNRHRRMLKEAILWLAGRSGTADMCGPVPPRTGRRLQSLIPPYPEGSAEDLALQVALATDWRIPAQAPLLPSNARALQASAPVYSISFRSQSGGGFHRMNTLRSFSVAVTDTGRAVNCNNVITQSVLVHQKRGEILSMAPIVEQTRSDLGQTVRGCSGNIKVSYTGYYYENWAFQNNDNIYMVLTTKYTFSNGQTKSATLRLWNNPIQAEHYTKAWNMRSVAVVSPWNQMPPGRPNEPGVMAVSYITNRDWLLYAGVTLDGVKSITVRYATGPGGSASRPRVEFRLTDPFSGPLIASTTLNPSTSPSNGNNPGSTWMYYQDAVATMIRPVSGTYNLHVVAFGDPNKVLMNLNYFRFNF